MHWATGFLVEGRCQRCWVGTGSGGSGRGSQEASSRWANKGRTPQEADSTLARAALTNCENKVTFSERSYLRSLLYVQIHAPADLRCNFGDELRSLSVGRSSAPPKMHTWMYDCINGHTCTSTFASIFPSLVAPGKRRIQQWYVLHSLTAKTR